MAIDETRYEWLRKNPQNYTDKLASLDRETYLNAATYGFFKELLGRSPTPEEYAQFAPLIVGQGHAVAKAQVAQLAQMEKNSPDKLAERKREELTAKAPGEFGKVSATFQSLLGRDATDAEKKHYGALLASGDVDEYSLQRFLQQDPEYMQKQDSAFREGLRGELGASDKRYFEESVLPSIQAAFSRQGRSVDSSGYAAALANAASGQNRERESYLSQLSASQYAGRQGTARADYENYISRLYGGQDYRQARTDNLTDQFNARQMELQNFSIQKQAYEDYLRRYGKRKPDALDYTGAALGGVQTGLNLYKLRSGGV